MGKKELGLGFKGLIGNAEKKDNDESMPKRKQSTAIFTFRIDHDDLEAIRAISKFELISEKSIVQDAIKLWLKPRQKLLNEALKFYRKKRKS